MEMRFNTLKTLLRGVIYHDDYLTATVNDIRFIKLMPYLMGCNFINMSDAMAKADRGFGLIVDLELTTPKNNLYKCPAVEHNTMLRTLATR